MKGFIQRIEQNIEVIFKSKIIERILDPKVFFLLVAFLLIQLWFSKGILFGGVEVGVPTYNSSVTLSQIIWTWFEAVGPGVSYPTFIASIPFYFFLTLL